MRTTTGLPVSARVRLAACVGLGVLVGAVLTALVGGALGILAGVAALHTTFTATGWWSLWRLDAPATRRNAAREDFQPVAHEIVVVLVSVGALVGIGVLLAVGDTGTGEVAAVIALGGVFMAWGSLHLMYAARYAHLYYAVNGGAGIDFNAEPAAGFAPTYRDFLYFSYVLGMTYAVADTDVGDPGIRSVVLRQTLLSYVFGAVILASTINLVAQVALH